MEKSVNMKEKKNSGINFESIGNINLKEAEEIANEEILFLSEDELIDGLDEFELIPLNPGPKEDKEPVDVGDKQANRDSALEKDEDFSFISEDNLKDLYEKKITETDDSVSPSVSPTDFNSLHEEYNDPDADSSDKSISESESEPETIVEEDDIIEKNGKNTSSTPLDTQEFSFSENTDSHTVGSNEEPVLEDKTDVNNSAYTDDSGRNRDFLFIDESLESGIEKSGHAADISLSESDEKNQDIVEAEEEDYELYVEMSPGDEKTIENEIIQTKGYEEADSLKHTADKKETLPDEIAALDMTEVFVKFIDDDLVEKPSVSEQVSDEETELGRLTSGMSQVTTGGPVILGDARYDHKTQFYVIEADEALYTLESMADGSAIDEYRFMDDEIDYIHSVMIHDDYKDYLKNIDVFHESLGKKFIPAAVDLFGLTRHEIEEIENELFEKEFEGVDLNQIFDFFLTDKKLRGIQPSVLGSYTYIQQSSLTLDDDEKLSIEADISSEHAVVFEEDIEDIKELHRSLTGEKEIADYKKDDATVVDEIPDINEKEYRADSEDYKTPELYDITDQVVIIEEEDDVDRFVGKIPSHKRKDIKNLLKYLDGLFEKLPESVVKNFASSEYFDLYVKVLNELE